MIEVGHAVMFSAITEIAGRWYARNYAIRLARGEIGYPRPDLTQADLDTIRHELQTKCPLFLRRDPWKN